MRNPSCLGKTDERGNLNEVGGHDVVHDVSWIHSELQRWILDNLRAKWSGVVRKPEHLYDMFTGYQAQVISTNDMDSNVNADGFYTKNDSKNDEF